MLGATFISWGREGFGLEGFEGNENSVSKKDVVYFSRVIFFEGAWAGSRAEFGSFYPFLAEVWAGGKNMIRVVERLQPVLRLRGSYLGAAFRCVSFNKSDVVLCPRRFCDAFYLDIGRCYGLWRILES